MLTANTLCGSNACAHQIRWGVRVTTYRREEWEGSSFATRQRILRTCGLQVSHYKLFQKYSITKCWAPLQNWKVSMSLVWMIITPSEEMSKGSSTYTWYNKICNRQTRFFCYIKFPICLLCYLFCLTEVAQLYYTNFLNKNTSWKQPIILLRDIFSSATCICEKGKEPVSSFAFNTALWKADKKLTASWIQETNTLLSAPKSQGSFQLWNKGAWWVLEEIYQLTPHFIKYNIRCWRSVLSRSFFSCSGKRTTKFA